MRSIRHVLLAGGSDTVGGAELFNSRLANLLAQVGATVTIQRTHSHLRRRPILNLFRYTCSLLRQPFIRNRPDTLTLFSCANALDCLVALLASFSVPPARLIVVAHFSSSWRVWRSALLVRVIRMLSRRSRFYCIAPSQREFFRKTNIEIQTDLFPTVFEQPQPRGLLRPQHPPYRAIYVGRVVSEKRVAEAVQYMRRAADAAPIEFRIVGDYDLAYQREIMASASSSLTVTFLGIKSQTEVFEQLRCADFFVSFSTSDTLPLSIMEACMTGVPVLTIKTPATMDVASLLDGIVFVDPADSVELAVDRIRQVVSTSPSLDKVSRLVQRNRAWVAACVQGPES
jgi:glycosyltransferase involved in cell wall biosynthesis